MKKSDTRVMASKTQSGISLMIVLLLLTVLSTIALLVTHTARLALVRTSTGQLVSQSYWYVRGAEEFAEVLMEAQWREEPARDTPNDRWAREPTVFPIEGGTLTAQLSDATECLNINSIVIRKDGALVENERGVQEFQLLLKALEFDPAARSALTDSLLDWMDSDSIPRPSGAEDEEYTKLRVPYRASNVGLKDVSELRAIFWYSPEVYRALLPYICIREVGELSSININMLMDSSGPVLYAMAGGLLTMSDVNLIIGGRPADGYSSIDQFGANLSNWNEIQAQEELVSRLRLWSEFIQLNARVSYGETSVEVQSLLHVTEEGTVSTVSRKLLR